MILSLNKFIGISSAILLAIQSTQAFLDKPAIATYWGQNSKNGHNTQKALAEYCDDSADIILLSFILDFKDGGLPELNLADTCWNFFKGTNLLHCPDVGKDIKACQGKGKTVLLSIGGDSGGYGFANDEDAKAFADTLWNLFGGGSHKTRPFDDAIVDGFDLDIEGGGPTGYVAMVNQLRKHFEKDKSKKYYMTATPQCPYPDEMLGDVINEAKFDAVNVQFYNNYCSATSSSFNFDTWDDWAKKSSPNKDVKVLMGIPGSKDSAGSGYVKLDKLKPIVKDVYEKYSSFAGVMIWDASTSYTNTDVKPDYHMAVANLVHGLSDASKNSSITDTVDKCSRNSKHPKTSKSSRSSKPVKTTRSVNPAYKTPKSTKTTKTRKTDKTKPTQKTKKTTKHKSSKKTKTSKNKTTITKHNSKHNNDDDDENCEWEGHDSQSSKDNVTEHNSDDEECDLDDKDQSSNNKKSTSDSSTSENSYDSRALASKCVRQGDSCPTDGAVTCSGDFFAKCDHGAWVLTKCPPTLTCFTTTDGFSAYCGEGTSANTCRASGSKKAVASGSKTSETGDSDDENTPLTHEGPVAKAYKSDDVISQFSVSEIDSDSFKALINARRLNSTPFNSTIILEFKVADNIKVTNVVDGKVSQKGNKVRITYNNSEGKAMAVYIIIEGEITSGVFQAPVSESLKFIS
ncbi:glycoside hydrolase superfamily [Mycotypha africana]|uniref:glycoside hydrolase superfamily n=1 Tax=Mycotypha africana TaxID=64632 RepID=UPI0023008632|nr:glycoside hydrolase superfamily [Mycotypha africana]KAI8982123.1 glycoside hydrolase superfamily [Mycotypha africana]